MVAPRTCVSPPYYSSKQARDRRKITYSALTGFSHIQTSNHVGEVPLGYIRPDCSFPYNLLSLSPDDTILSEKRIDFRAAWQPQPWGITFRVVWRGCSLAGTIGLSATQPTVLHSDGATTWVEERPPYDTPRGNPALQVRSTYCVMTGKKPVKLSARNAYYMNI